MLIIFSLFTNFSMRCVNVRPVSILLPDKVVDELKKLKKEKKIRSVSEFLRNIILHYLHFGYGTVVVRRRVEYEEWSIIRRDIDELRRDARAGYGDAHNEIMSQLRAVLEERKKKMKKKNAMSA